MSASKYTQQSTQAHPGSDLGNALLVACVHRLAQLRVFLDGTTQQVNRKACRDNPAQERDSACREAKSSDEGYILRCGQRLGNFQSAFGNPANGKLNRFMGAWLAFPWYDWRTEPAGIAREADGGRGLSRQQFSEAHQGFGCGPRRFCINGLIAPEHPADFLQQARGGGTLDFCACGNPYALGLLHWFSCSAESPLQLLDGALLLSSNIGEINFRGFGRWCLAGSEPASPTWLAALPCL